MCARIAVIFPAFEPFAQLLRIIRHLHFQSNQLIAAASRFGTPSFAFEPHHRAAIGARLDRQHDRAISRGAFHFCAMQSFVDRDRQIHADMIAIAPEKGVRCDFNHNQAIT